MDKLEESKYFPYVAWTTVILFVFFTFSLVVQLSETTSSLEVQANTTTSQ